MTTTTRPASRHPILVLGGTGKTGSRVAAALRARDADIRIASRSTEIPFEWSDESTWDRVLDGVRAVYLVPLDGAEAGPAFVRRAVAAGVERIVLLSARGVDTPGYFAADDPATRARLDLEAAVRGAGPAWTILRPGWFAQNFSEGLFRDGIRAGELVLPTGAAAVSFVDTEDIGAVAAAALLDPGHDGETYELSGPRALTFDAALAEIAAAGGRRADYVAADPDEYAAALIAQGVPEVEVAMWTSALGSIHRGLEAAISDGVPRALGRPARDFTEFVRSAAPTGAWTP
ncbi:NAD(P)-dependent oxidoreductase [Embleya scabrispora]|uniref:NAD(P)-dependent oxidoreductase n=1 Tax=Embleya scabrispora TaxID=159449 RepID=A0A1T3P4K4_9ACTN|nr:NAD(P)H-binding protein [Embleya scabrispora]OPC83881.1 NAD(P)-dependent oxidoreductase [Embleya scabrispora]